MVEISGTYDSKTFSNMGYVLLNTEWCIKDSSKERIDLTKVKKVLSNLVLPMMKEIEELKDRLKVIKEGLLHLQDSSTARLLQLGKEISTYMGKVHLDGTIACSITRTR